MTDKLKTIAIVAGFLGFLIGLLLGASLAYKVLDDHLFNKMRPPDQAIWIRIDVVKGGRKDLAGRLESFAQALEMYNFAVAQIKVYERRREVMNVRLSDDD